MQEAYDAAAKEMGPGARVIVMPFGGSTLPVLSGDGIPKPMGGRISRQECEQAGHLKQNAAACFCVIY